MCECVYFYVSICVCVCVHVYVSMCVSASLLEGERGREAKRTWGRSGRRWGGEGEREREIIHTLTFTKERIQVR